MTASDSWEAIAEAEAYIRDAAQHALDEGADRVHLASVMRSISREVARGDDPAE